MRGLYLKALEIQGFKSFPDKTVLTFQDGITAVVGPNGSGKSNIADAIRWVMGEQSTRALRGSKMEDVIFDGTARRRGLGFAEVSLVLDNSARLFPMDQQEIMVTRRYYRSGESEYYINRRSVRLRDINELFMDTGLGREGYALIGQGRIDEILSAKSTDRREIFEEAAGISRFRHRKEEARRKLERTQDNLVRINDKIGELELQVEPLRLQAEKTRKFLALRDELRGLEISLWLTQLEGLRAAAIRTQADYETAAAHREELRAAVEAAYAQAEACAAKMREKDVETDQIRFRLSQMEADAHSCESAIELLKNDMKNNADNARRIQDELSQQEGRAGSIAQQIAQRQARLKEIQVQDRHLRDELARAEESNRQAAQSAGALGEELEALRSREGLESASAAQRRELLSALAAAAQELYDREENLGKERIALEDSRQQAAAALRELEGQLADKGEEETSLQNAIQGYTLRAEGRRRRAEEAAQRVSRLEMDENNLSSRIHMLSEMEKLYEGYSKAVRLVMNEAGRGGLAGVHGPVAGLIQVPDAYTVAIEIALGGAMQNIVVDTDQAGKAAIAFLKRRDGGRATFLPVSTIRPAQFRDGDVAKEPGFVGMADALITCEPRYRDIFSNLLGRVVIVEDMDSAIAITRKFSHRFRVVTLDGQVINAGGSMTGGSASRSAGILSRANELQRLKEQQAALAEDLAAARLTRQGAQREHTAAQYQLDTAREQLSQLEKELLLLKERLESARQQEAALRERMELIRQDQASIQSRIQDNQRDTQAARESVTELEGAAEALRAEAEAKEKGQEELRRRVEETARQVAMYHTELAALEGERSASGQALEELEALRQELTGDREQRQALIRQYQDRNQALSGRILEQEEKLQALRQRREEQEGRIQRLNQEKLALEGERNQADRLSREQNTALLNMEREVSVLEQKKLSASMEEKQLLDRLWETYQLSHEAARQQQVELESTARAARRISELKRSISALGSINPDAVEEFQRVNERYTYFIEQRDDVEGAKRELEGIISGITREMTDIFSTQFQRINQAFQETFVELFQGGKANLELEDEKEILTCGIEIKVQPPGKALKNISLLSGGEKAFVAIALYFAILKVRPTPFCVMDEIEAALDDANVVRYASYLRSMTEGTQFIVITHRRGTMEEADILYGVTMQEQGVSRLLTIDLNDVEKELGIQ